MGRTTIFSITQTSGSVHFSFLYKLEIHVHTKFTQSRWMSDWFFTQSRNYFHPIHVFTLWNMSNNAITLLPWGPPEQQSCKKYKLFKVIKAVGLPMLFTCNNMLRVWCNRTYSQAPIDVTIGWDLGWGIRAVLSQKSLFYTTDKKQK